MYKKVTKQEMAIGAIKGNNVIDVILKMTVFSVVIFLNSLEVNAQVNVYPGQTAMALAQSLAGQGVIITGATMHCPSVANGLFKVVSSNLGLDSGIVLTTGRAATQGSKYGVNGFSLYLASNNNNAPGDPSLTTLAGQQTLDACSLEFDVIPNGDTMKFSYVFSSEEYINAVCGPYNDAFAFFISGPGITGTENMALVPGTHIPVTINSINNGVPGSTGELSNCTIMGTGSPFTAYYINNMPGATLTHQGFTTVLQAIHGVTPCASYHLKMVIADAGNALYDSGVFLKAGSLSASDYSVSAVVPAYIGPGNNDTSAFCIKGCLPGVFRIKRSEVRSQPQTVRFITGGNAISGLDYTPLADSVIIPAFDSVAYVSVYGIPTAPAGSKRVTLYIYPPFTCSGAAAIADSASMTIYDTVSIAMITPDTATCRNDKVQLQVNGYDFLHYEWTPTLGLSNPSVKEPLANPPLNTHYTVTATVPGTNCPAKSAFVNFIAKPTPYIILPSVAKICYGTAFTMPTVIYPESPVFSYTWSGPPAFTSTLVTPVINYADKPNDGIYYLLATNDTNGCTDLASIEVHVEIPGMPMVPSPQIFCHNGRVETLRGNDVDSLLWFSTLSPADTGSTYAPYAAIDAVGAYRYYVAAVVNHCSSPRVAIDVLVKQCCDGKIFIPNAFTPDGDGHNDLFEPVTDYGYFINSMGVFNRWGQAVYTGLIGGWDGRYGGVPAELGTYFYKIIFGCIQGGTVEKTGDVILIR